MGKLPKNVEDAVEYADGIFDGCDNGEWQTIRAELTRLYAIADSVDPLVVRLGEVTTQLEAAEKDAATEREIQNAADKLPDGYNITIYVEKGSGYIDLTDPDGDPVHVCTDDKNMAQQIAEATRAAIQAHLSEPRT